MAIPYRSGVAYALLGSSTGVGQRSGGIISDFQNTETSKPRQISFNSYQWHLNEYPNEDIAVVPLGAFISGRVILKQTEGSSVYEYPSDIVYEYDPNPPLSQQAPNPNGQNGSESVNVGLVDYFYDVYPRWHTDMPYSFGIDQVGFIPQLGETYYFDESNYNLNSVGQGLWGWDVSADNYDSWVINLSNNEIEYYPFLQTKNDLKITSKLKVVFEGNICCWNKGTIIRGKIGFNSVSVTAKTVPFPPPSDPEGLVGYAGISLKLGDSYDDAGTADWEVTVEDDFIPPEIEIPKVQGTVTFINDFWITEIVKA